MKTLSLLFIGLLLLTGALHAQQRFVTLNVGINFDGGPAITNDYVLKPNETGEVVSYPYTGGPTLEIIKDNATFAFYPDSIANYRLSPPIVVGPAIFRLRNSTSGNKCMCTLKITPESFPPDKTVVIPQGQGANIIMECSTNLIDWVVAAPGIYTNVPSAKFFRIRPERVP